MAKSDDVFKARIDEQLSLARNKEAARHALALLFPNVERVIKSFVPRNAGDEKSQKSARRISQKDYVEAYFSLNPEKPTWGKTEFQKLLDLEPKNAFARLNERIESSYPKDQSQLRRLFIELLDAAFASNMTLTQAWLDEIIHQSPSLLAERDPTNRFLFTIDNEDRLKWLTINALEKFDPDTRAKLLIRSIRKAKDLTLLSDVVRSTVGDKHPDGARDGERRVDLGKFAEEVRDELLKRIKASIRRREFWSQAKPSRLLWFWWGADLQSEVWAFTKRAMRTQRGLLGLLSATVGTVSSSEGNYERVDRRAWSKIVDLDDLAERARRLIKSPGKEADRQAALRFLDALNKAED